MEVSRNEVERYLLDVKAAIHCGRYQVSQRRKNQELYIDYLFSDTLCKEILLSLEVNDFSNAVQNDHPQHPEEVLYIFGKEVSLLPKFGNEEENVSLYIKFNKLSNQYLIVISFHKQEFPLEYKFKD